MRVRRAVAATGRVLIATGILLLLFVAYQLWGTGIATAREQRSLKADLVEQLGFDPTAVVDAPSASTVPGSTTTVPAPATTVPGERPGPTTPVVARRTDPANPPTTAFRSKKPPVPVAAGEAVGYLKIPRIDVGWAFVEGTTTEALKKGPGHYEKTPMPGQPGNAAIAGHRTTYGAPFYRLDEMRPGDPIYVVTRQGRFEYRVLGSQVVSPTAVDVLDPLPGKNTLTLTTCHPRFSAAKRLVVKAELLGEASEADVAPTPGTTPTTTRPPSVATPVAPGETVPVETTAPDAAGGPDEPTLGATDTTAPGGAGGPDTTAGSGAGSGAGTGGGDGLGTGSLGEAEDRGSWRLGWLAGDPMVWGDTAAWAMVCVAIWMLAWGIARRRRLLLTWLGVYAGFALPFLVGLYFAYENLARLLPANV